MEEKKKSGCLGVFLLFLLVCFGVAMIAWFSGAGSSPDNDDDYNLINNITLGGEEATTNEHPTVKAPEYSTAPATTAAPETTTETGGSKPEEQSLQEKYYYRQLNETEKRIYTELLKSVSAGKDNAVIESLSPAPDENEISRAAQAFVSDHPQFFWLYERGYRYYIDGDTTKIWLMCYDFWNNTMNPQKYLSVLQEKVQSIVNMAKDLPSDYEKALFVHDYLVTHTEYDYDGLAQTKKTYHDAKYEYIYNAYGCLVNEKCVCAGYARAYKLILDALGVECIYVYGDAGELHSWNCVQLDGEYYYVDTTWDDFGTDSFPNEASHIYFCMNSADLALTHTVYTIEMYPDAFVIPNCTADKYNYFTYNDLTVTADNRDDAERALNNCPGSHFLQIRFEGAGQKLEKSLIDGQGLGNFARIENAGGTGGYVHDEDYHVITIILD